jgi:hypothetical protein
MGARGVVIGLRLGHYTVRHARVACSRSVLARRRETFGSTNRPVADALRELAMVKMASGDEREALDLLCEGIVVLRLSTGDNRREFAGLHLDIGEQLLLQQKLDDVRAVEATEVLERSPVSATCGGGRAGSISWLPGIARPSGCSRRLAKVPASPRATLTSPSPATVVVQTLRSRTPGRPPRNSPGCTGQARAVLLMPRLPWRRPWSSDSTMRKPRRSWRSCCPHT